MKQLFDFAVLVGDEDTLGGYFLSAMVGRGLRIAAVIVDELALSPKDKAIFEERTEGRLPPLPNSSAVHTPFFFVANHNDAYAIELVRKLGVRFLVSAGTPRILKSPMLTATPLGVLNCHPGLLPDFRGCSCVEWAIYLDEAVGVTVHRMSEGIDEGPILLRRVLEVKPGDSYVDVRVGAYMAACEAMADAALELATGNLCDSNFVAQEVGRYFPPMEIEKLAQVKEKLAAGLYRCPPGAG